MQQSGVKIHLHPARSYYFTADGDADIINLSSMRAHFSILCVLAILCSLPAGAQSFSEALDRHSAGTEPVVFLHTDQGNYVPGETVWFKAYVMQGGKPFAGNSNLYVRLLSPSSQVISTFIFPVAGAVAPGSIFLPDTLSNGRYWLQVLTHASLGTGNSRLQPLMVTGNSRIRSKPEPELAFFAEGGSFMAGVPNRVAFRATVNEMPLAVSGRVKADDGTTITSFTGYHNGYGMFEMMPVAGKQYKVEIDWEGGTGTYAMPRAATEGIQLRIDDEKDGKTFQLLRVASVNRPYDRVFIVAQTGGQVVYEQEVLFENYYSVKGHLLTNELPSGVLHFAVFDADRRLLAERLSFVDNGEYRLNAEIKKVKSDNKRRAQQELELQVEGSGDLSASAAVVVNGNRFRENILSFFLLSSRVENRLTDPYWYMAGPADSAGKGREMMLMTQQSREVKWEEVLKGGQPASKTPADFIGVSGVVKDQDGEKAMGPGRLTFYLEAEDSSTASYDAAVDAAGKFRLDSMNFRGNAKLFYSFADPDGRQKQARLELDPDPRRRVLKSLITSVPAPLLFEPGVSPDLTVRTGQVQNHDEQVKILERVTLKNKPRKRPTEEVEEKYTSGAFKMQAAKTLDNINEPAKDVSMSVVDYIRNRMNDVELTGTGFVNRKTLSLGSATRWAVGIFLDESPADLPMLRTVRVGDVALVKFFDVGWVGVGSTYPGGAIAVYTKRETSADQAPQKMEHVKVEGYALNRRFVHIDYGQKDLKQMPEDHRQTIYWHPDLILGGSDRSLRFDFYNNDLGKPLQAVIQGFDQSGRLLFAEKQL